MDDKFKSSENQVNSIENKIWDYFSNLKLNNEQINRIKDCLNKEIQQSKNWEENSTIKEKKLLRKYKQIIEKCTNIEEWIKKIETELSEIKKEALDVDNQDKQEWNKWEPKFINKTNIQEDTQKDTQNENEEFKEITESIDKLLTKVFDSYNSINDSYKPTEEEIAQKKDSLPEETKKRLAENNISEEQYLQFSIAREKIYQPWNEDNTPETKAFLNSLKEFEDKLGITKNWLPLSASPQLFEDNPQLKEFKENNAYIKELDNISYFWNENIDIHNPESIKKTVEKYKKVEKIYKNTDFYPEDNWDEKFKFSEISKKINWEVEQEATDEEKIFYVDKLEKSNSWITEYSKMSAAQASHTWILKYLDSYNEFNKDSFENRFDKQNKEYIKADNSTIRIEWMIDGKPISFYYDTEDWETKISCDDVIHIENGKYEIYNWIWEYPKSDLKINMPSTKNIVDNLKDIKQDEYTKLLESSNDLKDFKSKITELITNKVNETYPDNSEVKTRMARFTEKNLTAQAFDSAILWWDTELKQQFNSKLKEWTEMNPLRRMLLLVDNTTEKSISTDLVELKQWFKKLEWLLWKSREELNRIKDPVAKESLLSLKNAKESKDYNKREKATIDFISLFEHRDDVNNPEFKMNIDDFSAFIELANKDEHTKESTLKNNFSPEFNKKYNESEPIKRENENRTKLEEEQQNDRDTAEIETKEANEERFDKQLNDEEIWPKED